MTCATCAGEHGATFAPATAILEQAHAAWQRGVQAGARVASHLDDLADELAELPGGEALQPLLAELLTAYVDESTAYSESAGLLHAAVAGCRCN